MTLQRLRVTSSAREHLRDITAEVSAVLRESGVSGGICHVFVQHTTAGIIVNENADPAVCSDMLEWLAEAIPQSHPFRHAEGNSPAHIKATLVGQSATVPIEDGRLALGTWQGIFFAEFDGPRERTVIVNIIGDTA